MAYTFQDKNKCSIDGCDREIYNKEHQLCNAHYLRLRRSGDPLGVRREPVRQAVQLPTGAVCTNEGCTRPITNKTRLLCHRCYMYWRKFEKPDGRRCNVDDCLNPHFSGGYCNSHYHRLARYGDPLAGNGRGSPGKRRGILEFKGENITKGGYKKIRVEDGDKKVRWILEHRYVMEQKLGRELLSDESVHHLDGDKLNNHIDNLELWLRPQPTGVRVQDTVLWAREIIKRYGDVF
jgi:HNH endonuclease